MYIKHGALYFGVSIVQHPALKGRLVEEFAELRLRKDVVDALRNIGVTQPTVIQVSQMDCRLQCIKERKKEKIMQPSFLGHNGCPHVII